MRAFTSNLRQSDNAFSLLSHQMKSIQGSHAIKMPLTPMINSALRKCWGGVNRSTSWIGVNPGHGVFQASRIHSGWEVEGLWGDTTPLRKTAQLQPHGSLKVNSSPCILYSTYLIGRMASTLACSLNSSKKKRPGACRNYMLSTSPFGGTRFIHKTYMVCNIGPTILLQNKRMPSVDPNSTSNLLGPELVSTRQQGPSSCLRGSNSPSNSSFNHHHRLRHHRHQHHH